MDNNENTIERIKVLRGDINSKSNYGLDCSEERKEVAKIENYFITLRFSQLNDDFIKTHHWESKHVTTANKWDLIVYKNIVCRVKDIYRTIYNEVDDTYSYQALLIGLFIQAEITYDFGYNDTIEVMK